MIKLKDLLKESYVWERKFGEKLPTLADVQRKKLKEDLLTEGTRWNVAIELPNGKVAAVYGHWDGYPQHVGKLLKQHYKNPAKIKQLLKFGKNGISSLDKDIKGGKDHSFDNPVKGQTVFYGRDRGEKHNMTSTYKSREDFGRSFGEEFGYVYSIKDKRWYYYDYHGREKTL